ncbi:uncharacterized protein LOC125645473 [Ostrea edulis]|uniref:uncharacterized protein LOC125645473 n=1 Tax=Ostrea edulis TaxID=37623 RepID=UPI0024AE8F15|nr:uncharacterized protein LOC125645473 [Ostrea edulis]
MTTSGNKKKLDEAAIEDAISALQKLSLSSDEVSTHNFKRRRQTRFQRTKIQSQIRRPGGVGGEHHKSHRKDLPMWSIIEQNVSAMLATIRESMSKKGSESAAAKSQKEPKAENKRSSRKRQRFDNPDETTSKRTKPACSTGSNLVDERVLRFSRLTLNP